MERFCFVTFRKYIRLFSDVQLRNFQKLGTRILPKIRNSSIAKKNEIVKGKFEIIITETLNREFPRQMMAKSGLMADLKPIFSPGMLQWQRYRVATRENFKLCILIPSTRKLCS